MAGGSASSGHSFFVRTERSFVLTNYQNEQKMATNKPVPSLSSDGWVTSTSHQADYLISYFFTSQYSQTYLYHGQISSFPWILQTYKNDMFALKEQTKAALTRLFGNYFPKVEIEVGTKEEDDGKYSITIVIIVTDNEGKEFSVGRLADVLDAKIVKIQNLNNTGSAA